MAHHRAHFAGADFLLGEIAVHLQPHTVTAAHQFRRPIAAQLLHRGGILHIRAALQRVPSQCAVHRPGVHVHKAQLGGDDLGVRAFATGAGAVDSDDNRVAHDSANNSSPASDCPSASRISTPNPLGGAAASFWKKLGNVFRTQAGSRRRMPGTFSPSIAKHIAMR